MTVAVSTITQTGQITLPKSIRNILGVEPHDQVALLSDGERVELVAVPSDPLTLGDAEAFRARVRAAEVAYASGKAHPAHELVRQARECYDL